MDQRFNHVFVTPAIDRQELAMIDGLPSCSYTPENEDALMPALCLAGVTETDDEEDDKVWDEMDALLTSIGL
jgi:hypothetical protein